MKHCWPSLQGSIDYISPAPSKDWQENKKNLVVLGSTGSIGVNALRIVEKAPHKFTILGLAGAKNVQLLAAQALQFRPPFLAVYGQAEAELLHKLLRHTYKAEILYGQEGYMELAGLTEANTVLSAQVGAAGLRATVTAALKGKVICLANKESLVLAGNLIRHICTHTGACILPVDSEHNALFQMLVGREAKHVKKLILTASGGPFRGKTKAELKDVRLKDALAHPNWNMGAKISIDSASLMNKGLEVIEAYHLYGIAIQDIDVVVHPQSIIHSLVEYADNSMFAHMGKPDMRMPIAHCLLWPHIQDCGVESLDLFSLNNLTFEKPDITSFPCLALARRALKERGDQCVVLNAANEAAVELFLDERIHFLDIATLIEQAMNTHAAANSESILHSMSFSKEEQYTPRHVEQVLSHIINLTVHVRQELRALVGV